MKTKVQKIFNNHKLNIIVFTIILLFLTVWLYNFYDSSKLILLIGGMATIINVARLKYDEVMDKLFDLLIKYRYIVALIAFILCMIFRIHGSSVGVFEQVFPDKIDNLVSGQIIGQARGLRSDEYNVQLPYYFSQYYNNYSLTSQQMSLAGQDMIIGYNAPVKDITMIAKPFTLGYLLFGNEIGLSWYWCSKLILFLLVSYEAFSIMTKNNKKFSVLGSFLVVFSPAMQWWFSPHMYDVFFWSTSLYVLGYYFFVARDKWFKWLVTILSLCGIVGFVIALFPSLQVALGLIALSLLIVTLVRDKEIITFKKNDITRIVIVVIGVGLILGRYAFSSLEEITLLNSTVYPGNRISTGGGATLEMFFFDITNLLTPYKDINILNNCEISRFFHLGMLFVLYFPFMLYKWKKNNYKKSYNMAIGILLIITIIIEVIFLVIGFPEWLAKITLFSYINRMNLVYSFSALLFTIWSIDAISKNKELQNIRYGTVCLVIFALLYYKSIAPSSFEYITTITNIPWVPKVFFIFVIGIFILIGILVFINNMEMSTYLLIALTIFSTWTINPIVKGTSAITNNKIYPNIQEIVNKDDSNWLSIGTMLEQNYLITAGAKCLNAVNFYPDYGKWKLIDPELKNDYFYNRYIHMIVALTSDETSYNLITPDSIQINLNIQDMKKWEVKYLLTTSDIGDLLSTNNINYEISKGDSIHYIYKLEY